MANVPETATYTPGIYQLETTDPVVGGPDGIDNLQAKQLASRTMWLKQEIEKLEQDMGALGLDNITGLSQALNNKLNSSSYTATDVINKLKTVDGAGSGLDADTLDGKHAHELLFASDYSSLAKDSQITTSSGYIGALPIGANLQAHSNYFHGRVNLDAGIYMVLMYGWLDQLAVSGSGISMNIRLMTGTGVSYGTHRNNITSGYQASGIYHTGLLVLKTAATVTADYTSYAGSSFIVPSANSESFRFVRIR